jgi:ABC-type uncharacterized transport system auxiliary subunit
MKRVCSLAIVAAALLFCLGGCAQKQHPAEIDTSWIRSMAVVVAQEAGQPLSLTLVESEVTRRLYHRFRLVTVSQLAADLHDYRFGRPLSLDPQTCAEIAYATGVDAILYVVVTGHEISFSAPGEYRAHVALAMQLIEAPTGIVRWSRSATRRDSSDTISIAVHEAASSAVWDCLKYIVGWESLVKGDSLVTVCSRTGLDLDAPSDRGGEIRVEAVAPNSSWEQAGLQSGDVIARVNGRPIDAPAMEWPAGGPSDGVSVTVERGEALVELTVRLEPPK